MTGIYLTAHDVMVAGFWFAAWVVAALIVGLLLGRTIHRADVVEGTTDEPCDDDTREIAIPREWMTRQTFETQL